MIIVWRLGHDHCMEVGTGSLTSSLYTEVVAIH